MVLVAVYLVVCRDQPDDVVSEHEVGVYLVLVRSALTILKIVHSAGRLNIDTQDLVGHEFFEKASPRAAARGKKRFLPVNFQLVKNGMFAETAACAQITWVGVVVNFVIYKPNSPQKERRRRR